MVFIEHNSLKSYLFLIPYLFHVLQDSCFSVYRFFRVQILQGPGPGSGSRVRVQVLEVAHSNSLIRVTVALFSGSQLDNKHIFGIF